MSGGHFVDYVYYQVYQFADELENDIQNNNAIDDFGYSRSYSDETILYLKKQVEDIRRIAKIMKEIDYLYSGDHGEDSFLKAVKNEKTM